MIGKPAQSEGFLTPRIGRDYVWLFVMNALWAVGYPVTAIALNAGSSPSLLAALRLTVAFLLFVPFLRRVQRWSWSLVGLSALLGILGFAVPLWLQIVGLHETDPAIAAISISLEPLLTILAAALITRQRVFWWQKAAVLLALLGSWILTGEPRPGHLSHLSGDLALFAAICCFVLYNVLSPRLTAHTTAPTAAALSFGFGALGSVAIWMMSGLPAPSHLSWHLVWSVGFLAFGATGLAYLLWLWVVDQHGSVTVSALFLYLQPLLGTVLSWVLGEAALTLSLILGGVLVLAAMALGQETHPFRRPKPAKTMADAGNSLHLPGDPRA
ncbi:MAG: DMT family transporter [Firmicutes bacterium]|nr:DMT family transporter [Bacillota bacterium]